VKILFKTISGSRLYGLAHENSDWDYYTVVDRVEKKKAAYHTHTIVDGLDSQVVDFGTWVNDCQRGVPQALEAMFSQKAEYDEIPEFRASFKGGTEYYAYRSIMKVIKFEHPDSFKHRRHMLRLGLNLRDLREHGRFNPTLSPETIRLISDFAEVEDMNTCYLWGLRVAYGSPL
jgi:predicted nucleotidyltransferase